MLQSSACPTFQRAACLSASHAVRMRQGTGCARRPGQPCRARKGGKRGPEVEEDVEIFNLETGWSVEALGSGSSKPGVLEGQGWSVEGLDTASDGWEDELSDDDDDYEDGEDDDGGDIWALAASAAPAAAPGRRGAARGGAAEGSSSKDGGGGGGGSGKLLRSADRALGSIPRHVLRTLERQQVEAEAEAARLRPSERKKAAARQKTHQRLRIISGTAAGRRLISPQGDQTRPMMEMVRGAVFNMILSLYGCQGSLPAETRWLDLFAGTGAIGIEALSRGCGEAHFVELSPWVVSNCLLPNLEACEVDDVAVVHTSRAEDFLKKALSSKGGRIAGGAFDFISVCPPYMLVDYEELYDLLEGSPLIHEESIVIVEYPKRLAHLVRDTLGPLFKMRDRRYGRTFIAIYGPKGLEAEE